VGRRRLRRIAWPVFAVFLIGLFTGITVLIVQFALDAGNVARLVAAAAWTSSFVVGWRAFSRSHGDVLPTRPTKRKFPKKAGSWAPMLGVIASSFLLRFSNSVQMVGLALVSGFMWPGFYWITRAFVKHPNRRERLWGGQLDQPDVGRAPADGFRE
jgi:hypothetical protein